MFRKDLMHQLVEFLMSEKRAISGAGGGVFFICGTAAAHDFDRRVHHREAVHRVPVRYLTGAALIGHQMECVMEFFTQA